MQQNKQFPLLLLAKVMKKVTEHSEEVMMKSQDIEEIQETKNYTYTNDTCDAQSFVYHVFLGVEVAYTNVHTVVTLKNGLYGW